MNRIADAAYLRINEFNPQECSKLLYALGRAGINNHKLCVATSMHREECFDLSEFGCNVIIRLSHIYAGGRFLGKRKRESTGTTGSTGGALWQDAVVLAKWLAKVASGGGFSRSVNEFLGQEYLQNNFPHGGVRKCEWKRKVVVELGAGLGFPSIVASCFRMDVIATDGDDNVLQLLQKNIARNKQIAGSRQGALSAKALEWGKRDSMSLLGLVRKPDIIIASGVVYGRDPCVAKNLAKSIRYLSSSHTIVILAHGNGASPGVHQCEGPFYAAMGKRFKCMNIQKVELDKDAQGCQLHIFVRTKRNNSENYTKKITC